MTPLDPATMQRVIDAATGAAGDYLGGYASDPEALAVYRHGMGTIVNVLTAMATNPTDTQTAVCGAIGRDTRGGPRWSVSGNTAHLVWGDGVILRARRQGKSWRVDWSGTYRTLADAAASRGFPPVGHPIDEEGKRS